MKSGTLKFIVRVIPLIVIIALVSCASALKMKKMRSGDVETIIAMDGSKPVYKLVYTYSGNKIVKGEYWEAKKKDAKETKDRSNILSKTAFAKKLEALLSGKAVSDTAEIKLDQIKDGFVLKFVKMVTYNNRGLPAEIKTRGYKKIPILGFFGIKVDRSYRYNNQGQVIQIVETNINVDSLLLNFGIGNITLINRDSAGRPKQVIKTIGSIPPVIETTDYYYYGGNSDNLSKTVYKKAGIDLKKLSIVPEKTITVWYNKNIPWGGKKKYFFNITDSKNAVSAFKIYNEIEKKDDLDLENFQKMSKMDKLMMAKKLYDLYDNEMMGPKWRMGELPDVPEPFSIYNNITWW